MKLSREQHACQQEYDSVLPRYTSCRIYKEAMVDTDLLADSQRLCFYTELNRKGEPT